MLTNIHSIERASSVFVDKLKGALTGAISAGLARPAIAHSAIRLTFDMCLASLPAEQRDSFIANAKADLDTKASNAAIRPIFQEALARTCADAIMAGESAEAILHGLVGALHATIAANADPERVPDVTHYVCAMLRDSLKVKAEGLH